MSLLTRAAPIAGIGRLTVSLVPIFSFGKLTRNASAALNSTQPAEDVAMLPDLTLLTTALRYLPRSLGRPRLTRVRADGARSRGASPLGIRFIAEVAQKDT